MEPQDLIDVSSQLRGIGHKTSRINTVRPWTPSQHVRPWEYAARWDSGVDRPRAMRNPALGADYVLDTPLGSGLPDFVDARDPSEIIGVATRTGARIACRFGAEPPKK